ncbi:MAG: hypothetical protein HY287_16570 [Planctomycetes bacterium]|nr:hypothetical protein [Planctomycetota bacterium]MBI3835941.1 hypothetical protein [Planctomycetota bacterium]
MHRIILREVLSLPTAPFAEHQVIEYIRRFCARLPGVSLSRDRAGNVLIHVCVGKKSRKRPLCITAHLDHPGFVADRMIARGVVRAFWRGGVPKEYFVGSGVRFWVDGNWIRGRIQSIKLATKPGTKRVHSADISVRNDIPRGSIGMWDFPDPVVRGSRIHARGCDDLAGAAAMLAAIGELCSASNSKKKSASEAYFLFTRAEEVGFIGAIAAARARTIPLKCFVVAMETSSERSFARIGDGPILRVGDKSTTFTHAASAYCHRVARELASRDKRFKFQRKLMDGGTCESSAYCALGYEATGLCVALGNYHNVDAKRKKLAPEFIDLNDYENVVRWFVALARSTQEYTGRDSEMDEQIRRLESTWRPLLR